MKPFQRHGSSAVLKRLIETSRMQIKALLFTSTWRPVTHWNHCVSMQWNNTPDYKWCFVVYYRRHALLGVPQPLAIRPGSISAAGQKNSPRQMTTVDHNGAAAAKRPHQDAALMPFWKKRRDGARDLTWERILQTRAQAHAHIIQSHKLFLFFWHTWTIGQSINVSNLHNSTLWLQPMSGSWA